MTIEIDGTTYYTLREFAEKTSRSYSYLRKCIQGLQRAKDLSDYVTRIEEKPFISEEALEEFEE